MDHGWRRVWEIRFKTEEDFSGEKIEEWHKLKTYGPRILGWAHTTKSWGRNSWFDHWSLLFDVHLRAVWKLNESETLDHTLHTDDPHYPPFSVPRSVHPLPLFVPRLPPFVSSHCAREPCRVVSNPCSGWTWERRGSVRFPRNNELFFILYQDGNNYELWVRSKIYLPISWF